MGSSFVFSTAHFGLQTEKIVVETDISSGLPKFSIVGLPDTAISESRERVRAAIKNSGLPFPRTRVTVNLAPADIKKQGPAYDLPIAISILLASGVIPAMSEINKLIFTGELSLKGHIRPVHGAILSASLASKLGLKGLVLAQENAQEASLAEGTSIFPFSSLKELVKTLQSNIEISPYVPPTPEKRTFFSGEDMAHIKGQEHVKRALEIAAAGAHNILLSGPPGSGKTLLARSVPTILPKPTFDESLEITKIHSIAGEKPITSLIEARPFRSPHHTSSSIALIGGGGWPRPGEISLAHRGVLFLDEFPEFQRKTIENLRQPLEEGTVTISRATGSLTFPAQFMLVAAMNPCPCGYANDPVKPCQCTPLIRQRYQQKISGPILDRIDLAADVPRIPFEKLAELKPAESSEAIQQRVEKARRAQRQRFRDHGIQSNSEMRVPHLKTFCLLPKEGTELLKKAVERLHLSARAYARILKVARTIADLSEEESIALHHLAEAINYRPAIQTET